VLCRARGVLRDRGQASALLNRLVEAENGDGESFGDAALPAFIQEKQNLRTEQFADLLSGSVLDWSRSGSGKGQEDDITILVVDMQDDGEAAPIAA